MLQFPGVFAISTAFDVERFLSHHALQAGVYGRRTMATVKAGSSKESTASKTKERDARSPVSTLALQIVHTAVQPDVGVATLAALAERDAAFAVKLLSLVNSPIHALAVKVTDVRHAAALLGARGIRDIALALAVSDMVPLGPPGEALMGICLRRAAASKALAMRLGLANPGEYMTAGLLLEIGILQGARSNVEGAGRLAKTPVAARILRERAAGLEPHPTTGSLLALEWRLPDVLLEAIRHHHAPTAPKEQLPHVTWVAEKVAAHSEGGNTSHARDAAISACAGLGMKRAEAESLLAEMPALVLELGTAFGRGVGPQPDVRKLLTDVNAVLLEANRSYEELIRMLETIVDDKSALVAELEVAHERLEQRATTDALTGVANRRTFSEVLARDIARTRRSNEPISVVLLDVDHFKKVNDEHGHVVGDAVLRRVGKLLSTAVRAGDLVARYGGEEFILLLPQTTSALAAFAAERLRSAVEKLRFDVAGGTFSVTASFGIATFVGEAATADELVAAADAALYAAKTDGRNRVAVAPAAKPGS
jgi:diguanylate cyclase (GGDEF)-like protein